MPEILESLVPLLVGGLLLLAALLFVIALWFFRRGRREPYWRMRRSASLHGWELFLVSLTMGFVAAAICLFSGFAQVILEGSGVGTQPEEVPTGLTPVIITATPQPSAIPVAATETILPRTTAMRTWTPTIDVSPTMSPSAESPTATSTQPLPSPSPGPTSTPLPTDLVVQPLPALVTPLAGAILEITVVDSAVTNDFQPATGETPSQAGITRIYFWVRYSGLTDGIAWERRLLVDDVVVQGGAYLWSGGEEGVSAFFFGEANGFPPGTYEIRLSLAGQVVAGQVFTLE